MTREIVGAKYKLYAQFETRRANLPLFHHHLSAAYLSLQWTASSQRQSP